MSEQIQIELIDSSAGQPDPQQPLPTVPQSDPQGTQPGGATPAAPAPAPSSPTQPVNQLEEGLKSSFGRVIDFLEKQLNKSWIGRAVVNSARSMGESEWGQSFQKVIDNILSKTMPSRQVYQPPASSSPLPTMQNGQSELASQWQEVVRSFKDVLSSIGNSRVGRFGRSVGSKVAKSRVGQATSGIFGSLAGMFGRGGATAGTSATAGAGAAGGAAGGAGTAVAVAGGGAAAGAGAAAGVASIVPPIAAAVVVIGGLVLAVTALNRLYRRQADELEQFNGAIAGVRAEFEARRIAQYFERGQAIGAQVAQVDAARNRLDEALFDLVTEIYKILAKAAPLIEMGIDFLTVIIRALETMVNEVQAVVAFFQLDFVGFKREINEAIVSSGKMVDAIKDLIADGSSQGHSEWVLGQNPFAPMQQVNVNPNPGP